MTTKIQEQIAELRDKTAGVGIHFGLRDKAANTLENLLPFVDIAEEFVERCDKGFIQSKHTYDRMKKALKELE